MSALPASLPTPRDENWKYVNLRGLARARFEPSAPPSSETQARVTAALPAPLDGFERIVLIDGFVLGTPVTTSPSSPTMVNTIEADRYFFELNRRLRTDTLRLDVARHQKRAIEVIVVSLGTSHPAVEIALAEGAELSLVERHLPLSTDAVITNLVISAVVGSHARLELSRITQASSKAQHVETIELHLGEGSTTKVVQLTTGAAPAERPRSSNMRVASPRSSGTLRRSVRARSRTTHTFASHTRRPAPKRFNNSGALPRVDHACRSTAICVSMRRRRMRNPTNL